MFKAFFRLWLVVFIPLFILIFPNSYSPITLFNEYAEKERYVDTYRGTFYLLQQQLNEISDTLKQKKIAEFASKFGYGLELKLLEGSALSDTQVKTLLANEFVFINTEPEFLVQKLTGSNWLIYLALDITQQEELIRASKGPLFLLKQQIQNHSREEWPALLKKLSKLFHFELSIESIGKLNLNTGQLQNLDELGITWIQSEEQQLTFYTYLDSKDNVLIAEAIPINSVTPSLIIILLLIFVIVISVGMFMWVNPLWRDLNRLADTAGLFGRGHLSQRATLSNTSVIARLGVAFNQMAGQIEALIKGQKELTNAIAHDLRTPLYRLRFAFEMLSDDDLSKEQKTRYQQSIVASIDGLDHLINQTLVFARYGQSSELAKFEQSLFADKLREEITCIQEECSQLDVKLSIQPSLEHLGVIVDEKAMLRALNNLVSNACKFAKQRVVVSFSKNEVDNSFQLIVEDDGPGIDEAKWQQVFQPFTQLHNQQRAPSMGHGLGLAIVQQIATLHDGKVELNRSELSGAKFSIFWPVK